MAAVAQAIQVDLPLTAIIANQSTLVRGTTGAVMTAKQTVRQLTSHSDM